MEWIYDRVEIEFRLVSELTNRLNELGGDGWEVIYYNETPPKKFGDNYKVIVLLKKGCNENKKCT